MDQHKRVWANSGHVALHQWNDRTLRQIVLFVLGVLIAIGVVFLLAATSAWDRTGGLGSSRYAGARFQVTLVISFFKAGRSQASSDAPMCRFHRVSIGEDLDAALHGGFSAVFGIMGKRQAANSLDRFPAGGGVAGSVMRASDSRTP